MINRFAVRSNEASNPRGGVGKREDEIVQAEGWGLGLDTTAERRVRFETGVIGTGANYY